MLRLANEGKVSFVTAEGNGPYRSSTVVSSAKANKVQQRTENRANISVYRHTDTQPRSKVVHIIEQRPRYDALYLTKLH